ncbi:hypothetical protein FF38_04489 [Lucilia cuprina]|uniref:Uncharacterized protein n=1 Tax=Lucilia cuprina TaxID=7375 RepID=A0A0L0CD17_LUCCU|nr:hypothetical protein FF38_04489 [Lucilia cuprina]
MYAIVHTTMNTYPDHATCGDGQRQLVIVLLANAVVVDGDVVVVSVLLDNDENDGEDDVLRVENVLNEYVEQQQQSCVVVVDVAFVDYVSLKDKEEFTDEIEFVEGDIEFGVVAISITVAVDDVAAVVAVANVVALYKLVEILIVAVVGDSLLSFISIS